LIWTTKKKSMLTITSPKKSKPHHSHRITRFCNQNTSKEEPGRKKNRQREAKKGNRKKQPHATKPRRVRQRGKTNKLTGSNIEEAAEARTRVKVAGEKKKSTEVEKKNHLGSGAQARGHRETAYRWGRSSVVPNETERTCFPNTVGKEKSGKDLAKKETPVKSNRNLRPQRPNEMKKPKKKAQGRVDDLGKEKRNSIGGTHPCSTEGGKTGISSFPIGVGHRQTPEKKRKISESLISQYGSHKVCQKEGCMPPGRYE